MAEFRLVEAKIHHCGQIVRRLRDPQKEGFAALGLNPHTELRERFGQSSFKRAWLINGRLAGLCGVTGSLASSTGYVWAALSEECARYPKETSATARRMLTHIMDTRQEIFASVFAKDEVSVRFAEFLGFNIVENQDHENIILMIHKKN